MERALWQAMLDSDFNSRYWCCITEKYTRLDLAVRIFLAVFASGTVAGWSFWSEPPYDYAWKALSGAAAIISIASSVLTFNKKITTAAEHAGLWTELRVHYADLWETFRADGETPALRREHARLRKVFAELESREPGLQIARDDGLARRCQQDVLRARRIHEENQHVHVEPSPGRI